MRTCCYCKNARISKAHLLSSILTSVCLVCLSDKKDAQQGTAENSSLTSVAKIDGPIFVNMHT